MTKKLFVLMEMCFDLPEAGPNVVLDDLETATIAQIGRNYELGQYAFQIEEQRGEEFVVTECRLLIGHDVLQSWLDKAVYDDR